MNMIRLSTFWSCNHLESTETVEDRRKPLRWNIRIPIRPVYKFLNGPCLQCLAIPETPKLLAERAESREVCSAKVKAEAKRIMDRHKREVAKAWVAKRRAIRGERIEWMIRHGRCEGCGSRLKQAVENQEPVCRTKCHTLWKKEMTSVRVRPETFDDVANRYLLPREKLAGAGSSTDFPVFVRDYGDGKGNGKGRRQRHRGQRFRNPLGGTPACAGEIIVLSDGEKDEPGQREELGERGEAERREEPAPREEPAQRKECQASMWRIRAGADEFVELSDKEGEQRGRGEAPQTLPQVVQARAVEVIELSD